MIKSGDAIYIDMRNKRLYSRRSKNRIFFGWSHNNDIDIEEGCKINYPSMALTDPKGFGKAYKGKDFEIRLP